MTSPPLARLVPPLLMLAASTALGAATTGDDYGFGRGSLGAWVIPVPLDIQAANDLVPGQGVYVMWVRPSGTASQMGIQPGDVILDLNGQPVANRHDVRSVIAGLQPGDQAHAEVQSSDGAVQPMDGTVQPRQRWRPFADAGAMAWGGPGTGAGIAPPAAPTPVSVDSQRQDLLAQQALYTQTELVLADLRRQLAQDAGIAWGSAWQVEVSVQSAAPAATFTTDAAPGAALLSPAIIASRDATPEWELHIALAAPRPH